MNKLIILLACFQLSINFIYATDIHTVANFTGDCNSSDSLQNFESVIYLYSSVDTLGFSYTFTDVATIVCNSNNVFPDIKFRKHNKAFNKISFNSSTYSISNDILTLSKMYTNYDITNSIDYHVFEIRAKSNNELLAIDYGSLYKDSTNKFLNFLLVCDSLNPYASQYSHANLSYTQIFSLGGGYLYEITDDDRGNILVGLKYKSPLNSQVFEKFLIPKL